MTDLVVYEDTPLAEYLSSFDGADSAIKLPPLQTHSDEKKGSFLSRMSPSNEASYSLSRILLHYWQRSLLHDTFTVCLPLAEESAFEERFKYLIVTSPLLSEVLSVHNANRKKQKHAAPHMTTDYSTPTFKVSKAKRVSTAATVSGLLAALGAESALIHQQQANGLLKFVSAPFTSITTLMTGSLSIFLLYRHMRRNGIRQLYQTTLSRLQSLMESCETLDNKVHRAIITIQEIELVSRGYRLSIPLSPISRIEQSSKTRRCTKLRNRLAVTLRRAFIVFEEGIIDLTDQVNKQNLSRLYDMYNVKSIASLSAVDRMESNGDSNIGCSLDCLRTLAQLMHAKRRECMMQLLALNIVTEEHDSIRHDYQNGWKAVNTVLLKLTEETKKFTDDVSAALENELCKPATDMEMISRSLSPNSTSVTDNRLKLFLHKLASLDQQLRTLEAKVYLCNQDIRQVASGESDNISPDDLREQLRKEYMSIQHDLSQMATDWEAGRAALLNFLEPPELDLSPSSSSSTPESPQKESPSPLPSPSMEGTKIFNSEETSILDLPLPARPSVFEAVVEMAETSRPERSCKSRAERIAEMKAKREQEAREKSNRMDTQNMVHELKDVLGRRVTEFDLEPTDKTEDK